jgi:hypothetical protein
MIYIVKITQFCRNTFMLKENLKREKSRAFSSANPIWLTWQKKFRTFDWIDAIGDLETTNKEINHLLSLTNN